MKDDLSCWRREVSEASWSKDTNLGEGGGGCCGRREGWEDVDEGGFLRGGPRRAED